MLLSIYKTQRDRDAERQESAQADARALEKARHVLALLEEKAAGYGALARPVHLEVELEEKRQEVAELEARRHDAAGERESDTAPSREERGLATLLAQLEGDPGEAEALKLAGQLRECWRSSGAGAHGTEQETLLGALDALCERALGLPFAALLPEEVPSEAESDAETGARLLGEFPETRYGFVGRARELWKLERLLAERCVIVLHAFGGQGKTALATEAAAWLTRKGRFARAVFLSFEQGGAADWALTQLGRLLLGNAFSALGEAERLPALLHALDAAPTLLLWDNFESVLAGAHAALAPQDLDKLLELGATLVARSAKTRLLVTTRDPELPHEAFRPGKRTALLPLEGLARWEALELAGAALDALGAPRPPRLELERLLDFLGRHPLSIQLVTPHLREFPDVQTVIEHFEALYPGFTEGQAQRRDESLEVSLRFSLERLSGEVRERIAALGVFEGGAFEMQILKVTGLKPSEWQRARAELVRAGLALVEMESPFSINTEEGKFGGHFLRFHPTLAPALRRQLGEAQLAALEEAYWQAYYQLAGFLYHTDDRDPMTARAAAQRELPNLRRGVTLALRASERDAAAAETAVDFADSVERFLDAFGRLREREVMMAEVERAFGGPQTADGGPQNEGVKALTRAEYLLQSRKGEMLLDAGRAREAEGVFRGLLARMERGAAETGEYERALTLGRLGRSLSGQGRAGEAEEVYRQELEILATLGPTDKSARQQTGFTYADLADVLLEQGHYSEARQYYTDSLQIAEETGNERSAAVALGQLGTLALMEGDFEEAERRYREALARFAAMGETRSEAIAWHQLGMVYQEVAKKAGEGKPRAALLQQADEAYGRSLQLKEALGDRALAATTANQLAIVAEMAGRPGDAARWYRRALRDFQASGQVQYVAGTCNNLAGLLLDAARGEYGSPPPQGLGEGAGAVTGAALLAEAEALARQGREIVESIGDLSLEPWKDYSLAADIAEAKGDAGAARGWRRKERATYVAFPGHWERLARQWGQVVQAVAAVARASTPQEGGAMAHHAIPADLDAALQRKTEHGWTAVTAALRDILAGARDAEALVEKHNLDREDYLIVTKTLEALAGNPGTVEAPPASPSEEAPARALMEGLQAWVGTPAGEAALRELQAQGLGQEALVIALLQRFVAAQGGGKAGNK